ncbi:MAG: O-antigen ligase family protein [Bryobacteraceae bacterium]
MMASSAIGARALPIGTPGRYFPAGIDRALLFQSVVASAMAWGLMAAGSAWMAAGVFWALLVVFLGWHGLNKSPERISALLLATLPAVGEFRNVWGYNAPQALYFTAFLVWYEFRRPVVREVMRDKAIWGLIIFSVGYWLISWFVAGNHNANFRMVDASMSAVSVLLLYREVKLFRTAMLGLGLCVLGEGMAFLSFGGRLGRAEVGDLTVGNPMTFGVPAALLVLLGLVHGGRLLQLKDSPMIRYGLLAATGVGLLLSTSRGSWLVTVVGIGVIFVFDRARRVMIVACFLSLVAGALILAQTERGAVLDAYLTKTFDPDVSIDKRTTGRAAQWRALPVMLADSPLWGHGPGLGKEIAAEYAGRGLLFHSLYLHMGAEAGMIGLGLVIWFVAYLAPRCWMIATRYGDPVPLMALAAFLTIGVSVIALDLSGGAYLGLAMLQPRGRLWIAREAVLIPAENDVL